MIHANVSKAVLDQNLPNRRIISGSGLMDTSNVAGGYMVTRLECVVIFMGLFERINFILTTLRRMMN